MCTVSWVRSADGYELLCNRDEKRTRAKAIAPLIQCRDGVRFIAPADGDFGGSWICANEFGVSLCLLNGAGLRAAEVESRGLLLLVLASSRSVDEVCKRASATDLFRFAPFSVVTLEPHRPALLIEWDGSEMATVLNGDPYMPLISSSFDTNTVQTRRRQEFERHLKAARNLDANLLHAFHESHCQTPDAYSPCMHRTDAETVSFSWVQVSAAEVGFFYSPASPCAWHPGERHTLPRYHAGMEFNDLTTISDCLRHAS